MKNSKQKLIFLDIDGTIYSGMGVIPKSTKEAIKKARKNGHNVYLSTGRSKAEISKDILDLEFDGIVASSGAYVEVQGKRIFNQHLDPKDLDTLYDYLYQHKIMFTLETNDRIYGLKEHIELQKQLFGGLHSTSLDTMESEDVKQGIDTFSNLFTVTEDVRKVSDVNKILFFNSFVPVKKMKEDLGNIFTVIYGTIEFLQGESGEIYAKTISKATGIQQILAYIKRDVEDTIAFGDGQNDMEMIQYVGVGVAMGNGVEELKQVADYVTKDVTKDGLHHGFEHLGLI